MSDNTALAFHMTILIVTFALCVVIAIVGVPL